MKRISHRDLESLRSDPAAWVASKKSGGFPRFGYGAALRNAVSHFHKTGDSSAALAHMLASLDKNNLNNQQRRQESEDDLAAYIHALAKSNSIFIERNPKVFLPLGNGVILGGLISKIDLNPTDGSYQAILLGPFSATWKDELRMPLIQRAIANKMKRDESDVQVGVQALGDALMLASYSAHEIDEAFDEATELTTSVIDAVP
jgi:hypothetical protein